MNKTEIIEKVQAFLVADFEAESDEISPEANMHETLDLDSLDYVDMVVSVENSFGFKMKGDDFKTITTFEDFYAFISNKI